LLKAEASRGTVLEPPALGLVLVPARRSG